jgi:hypothetical protein
MLIAGASGTGKSAFLRTIITSLALTHSPAQLHLYLIDFGGQALRVFEKLPQTPLLTSKSFCCGHETCVSTLLWQDHQPISPARMPCCSKYALAV